MHNFYIHRNERYIKKVFSNISLTEYKIESAIKKEIETVAGDKKRIKKKNPIDRQRNIMQHFKCNSDKNFARDCTSSRNDINIFVDSDQVYFSLFNVNSYHQAWINHSNIKISHLVKEALGRAVLDSLCAWTVAGEFWFINSFIH